MTIRAAVLTGFVDLARDVGLDALRLLDAVGIPRAALNDPDMRISALAIRDLMELCGRTTEDWGLRLMERRPLSVMGPLMLILREQPTVRAGLAAVTRFNALHHAATSLQVEEFDDLAIARLLVHYDSPGPSRQAAEASIYQLLRYLRLFLGSEWRPLTTAFIHARPGSLATHHRVFGANLEFNRDFHGLVFPRADLDARNEAADPEMARHIERYVNGLRSVEPDVRAQTRELVMSLLATGDCNIKVVAQQMAVDPRTLQRRLARAGAGFSDVVQGVRLDLAVHFLEDSDRPLVDVAGQLGFSALSAFSRWHHEHCGVSPSERRAAARRKEQRLG